MTANQEDKKASVGQEVRPYRGLNPFTTQDSAWFHGREAAVKGVLTALRHHQLVLLVGPSAGGKTSLVQAGVIPSLAEDALAASGLWSPVLVRSVRELPTELERGGPTAAADEGTKRASRHRLEGGPAHAHPLLVIDHFEEFLDQPTAPDDAAELVALTAHNPATRLLLVMRDNAYPRLAARCPELLSAALPGLVNLPATLTDAELYAIITRPAEDAGARFEDGMPERIIEDLRLKASGRPTPATFLPSLQLALRQLWERRTNGSLTHQAYESIGGVDKSLAAWCDDAIERLPAAHRPIAQRILTALADPADETLTIPATRRQVCLSQLKSLSSDVPASQIPDESIFDDVVTALSRNGIITTTSPSVAEDRGGESTMELVHEELVRDWGSLREWVARDRRFQSWLRRAREQVDRYASSGLPADLLTGTILAEGVEWADQRPLPADVSEFLATSEKNQRSPARRVRRLNAVLVGLLCLALIATGLAVWERQGALDAQRETQRVAQSRQLAAQSSALLEQAPDIASLLAVHAYRIAPTREAHASLLHAADLGLQHYLTGHDDSVEEVAFSPDGRMLASASWDGTVRLWDAATGDELHTLTSEHGTVNSVVFSPDGQTLATVSSDATVQTWDTATGEEQRTLTGFDRDMRELVFSPDGLLLASGNFGSQVLVEDSATGEAIHSFTDQDRGMFSLEFSPDGQTLVGGSSDGMVLVWDTTTGEELHRLTGHDEHVFSVGVSPDGQTLASGGLDGTVRLWDAATGEEQRTLTGHDGPVHSVVFSPDGQTLVSGSSDGTMREWGTATGKEHRTRTGLDSGVFSVGVSPDGQTLASGGFDGTVRLWDAATGEEQRTLTHEEPVLSAGFSPNGYTLASGDHYGSVRLWDVTTGDELHALTSEYGTVNSVVFSPDGQRLASVYSNTTVRLWDVTAGEELRTFTGHVNDVTELAFSPDGKTLASASYDDTVRLWDAATGEELHTLTHDDWVHSVAFSPDGQTLASGSSDGTVRLWDANTGKERRALTADNITVHSVAFSPDGQTLASGGEGGTVRLWDANTGKERRALTADNITVHSVAFSPDGQLLASGGGEEGTVQLWDADTGEERRTLTGHEHRTYVVMFSPDGRRLASASFDGTVRIWDTTLPGPRDAVEQICQAHHRDFTPSERTMYLQGLPHDAVCPA